MRTRRWSSGLSQTRAWCRSSNCVVLLLLFLMFVTVCSTLPCIPFWGGIGRADGPRAPRHATHVIVWPHHAIGETQHRWLYHHWPQSWTAGIRLSWGSQRHFPSDPWCLQRLQAKCCPAQGCEGWQLGWGNRDEVAVVLQVHLYGMAHLGIGINLFFINVFHCWYVQPGIYNIIQCSIWPCRYAPLRQRQGSRTG